MSLLETETIWISPYPSYFHGGQSQPWRHALTCFLDLQVTQPCKMEKKRVASNIGNFCNKNKQNISPIIILLPPVSLTFSIASESLNLYSSNVCHRLYRQHRNAVAVPHLPQKNPPLPKPDRTAAAIL